MAVTEQQVTDAIHRAITTLLERSDARRVFGVAQEHVAEVTLDDQRVLLTTEADGRVQTFSVEILEIR
jgi:hypothetical protein